MENFNPKVETLKKNQRNILKLKYRISEMNSFHGLSIVDTIE
jgi:hypothetical protein